MIIIEFSVSQNAFHKTTLNEMCENNMRNIISGRKLDYLPIGFFVSDETADAFVEKLYATLKSEHKDAKVIFWPEKKI